MSNDMRGKQATEIVPGSGDGAAPSIPAPSFEEFHPNGRYWACDVARILFGRDVEWLYRHRARLEAEESFPQPISQIGRPRWSGRPLLAWQNRSSIPESVSPSSGPAEPVDARGAQGNVVSYDDVLRARARLVANKRRP